MIGILSNVGRRTRHRGGTAMAVAGYKPATTTCAGVADYGESPSCPNLESVNMLNRKQGGLRVTNPQGLERIILLVLLTISYLPFMGQSIKLQDSSVKEGDKVSTISEITLSFDFSDAAVETGKSVDELGVASTLLNREAYRLLIYKGGKDSDYIGTNQSTTNEFVVGSGFKTIAKTAVVAGNHTITIPLLQPVTLNPGELYTVFIPKGKIMAGVPGTLYAKTATTDNILIEIEGTNANQTDIKLISSDPTSESEIETLKDIRLSFNQEVKISNAHNIFVSSNGSELAKAANVEYDGNTIIIYFDNVKLYKGHDYLVTIPSDEITSSDGSVSMGLVSLLFKGASYNYLPTGRIMPSNGKEVSWLSSISIPFTFPEGYNIGRLDDVFMKVYEGSMDAEPFLASCNSDIQRTLIADVWKFDLKPNTIYYVVLDEGAIFPARTDDYRIKLKDTTNERIVLEYTTPATLEVPTKVTLASSTPEHMEACERIDNVVIDLERYEFESNFYGVKCTSENPTATFSDGTSETVVPISFTSSETEGTSKASISINRPLEAGKEYTLKVPANTFIPNANENLAAVAGNDEILLTIVGKEVPVTEYVSLSYTVDGEVTLKTFVEKGKDVTVSVTAPEGRTIESVTLDGIPLTGVMDVYTIPALSEDAGLLVALSPIVVPEKNYYDVTLTIDNAVAQTSAVEEGKTVGFVLTPADDLWVVESVDNATLVGDKWETAPVESDLEVKAHFALAKEVDFDFSVGVDDVIADCAYSVYSEGDGIMIGGVTSGDRIRVYTVGGSLIADRVVPNDMNVVRLTLDHNVYIIAINDITLKVRH